QNCQSTTLNPGQSCQMLFAFTPAALGPATGASIGSWNGQSFHINFTGTGTPRLLISPSSLDFGYVAVGTASPQQTVTITNASSTPIVMSGAGGGLISQFHNFQNCQSNTLNPGDSCTMTFWFAPTSLGPASDVSIGTWNNQPFNITVTGIG